MKILHVIDQINQQKHGGSAKVPYELSREQASLGHEVTIFASDWEADGQQAPPGVKLVKFKAYNVMNVKVTPDLMVTNFKQFDILHLHNYRTFVNLVASKQKVPYVLQAHGSCVKLPARLSKPLHNFLWKRQILNHASALIADADMEIILYQSEGAPAKKIVTIPVGININEFAELPAREEHKGKVILFLGRFDKLKGMDVLAQALKVMDREDVILEVAGVDYGAGKEFKDTIWKLGLRDKVRYLGALYGRDKLSAYVNADAFILASRYEMWGLTFLEALACGTPVVMTDRCGAARMLPEECGVVTKFDPESIAQGINKTLDDDLKNKHQDFRQYWVRQFGWDKIAQKILNVYEGVLNG